MGNYYEIKRDSFNLGEVINDECETLDKQIELLSDRVQNDAQFMLVLANMGETIFEKIREVNNKVV